MKQRTDVYWPLFVTIAALGVAAVWRFAPTLPLSSSFRHRCVTTTHALREMLGLETAVAPREEEAPVVRVTPLAAEPAARPAVRPVRPTAPRVAQPKASPAERPEVAPAAPMAVETETAVPAPAPASAEASASELVIIDDAPPAETPGVEKASAEPVASEDTAAGGDDPLSMTPAQRKAKYAALTRQAEARKMEILRANVTQSPEGRAALAAVKAFKDKAAEVEALKKKYGETDSRVTRERGNIVRLKEEVRRANERYKAWKKANPGKIKTPEEDLAYRKIIGTRQLYSE